MVGHWSDLEYFVYIVVKYILQKSAKIPHI